MSLLAPSGRCSSRPSVVVAHPRVAPTVLAFLCGRSSVVGTPLAVPCGRFRRCPLRADVPSSLYGRSIDDVSPRTAVSVSVVRLRVTRVVCASLCGSYDPPPEVAAFHSSVVHPFVLQILLWSFHPCIPLWWLPVWSPIDSSVIVPSSYPSAIALCLVRPGVVALLSFLWPSSSPS